MRHSSSPHPHRSSITAQPTGNCWIILLWLACTLNLLNARVLPSPSFVATIGSPHYPARIRDASVQAGRQRRREKRYKNCEANAAVLDRQHLACTTSPFLAMTKISAIATAALLASYASAHTIFQKLYVNGVDQGELTGIRAPDYDGVRICLLAGSRPILTGRIQPIQDVTSNDIICNGGSSSSSEHERSTTDSLLRYQSLPPARLYGCDQRPCWCNSHC